MQWILNHWVEVVAGILGVLKGLEVLAKLTKTDKDDKIIRKLLYIIGLAEKKT